MEKILSKVWDFSVKNFGLPITMLILVCGLGGYGAYAGYKNTESLNRIDRHISELTECCKLSKADSVRIDNIQDRVHTTEGNIATIKAQNEIMLSMLMQIHSTLLR